VTTPAPTRVPILMYHEIAARTETRSRLAVRPDSFAAQVRTLHDDGFRTLTAHELASALASEEQRVPERAVVLTFDDGYADFHGQALPLLGEYGFSATVFVTTGWVAGVGVRPATPPLGRMLTWRQIEEASGCGMEFAAHSRTHPQLDRLSEPQLRDELTSSKAELEDRLGAPVTGLAYPFGYSNSKVREAARQLAYGYGCAVSNAMAGTGSDLFALPRLTVAESTTLAVFRQLVRGDNLGRIYLKDHAMTKGWALARRSMETVGRVRR
jgi:peptidoglycan/xylan/chitin deacetylase (PgdA/CDA1 family)